MEPDNSMDSELLIVDTTAALRGPNNNGNQTRQSTPEVPPPPLPAIVSAANLIADNSKEKPPELIKGVLHKGLKGVVAAPSKAGKTWLLLDLAVSVASGLPWLRWQTEKARVLLVNFEIPSAFIRDRLRSVANKKGVVDMGNLDVWTLRGFSAPFETLIPRMIERIRSSNYALVILDPVYKGLGDTDENNASAIATLCNNLEQLCVQTDAALVYAHHYSKGNKAGKDALDRMSGSGVFARDADTIINLTPHEEDNCLVVDVVLRNLENTPSFVVERTIPVFTVREDLNPQQLARGSGAGKKFDSENLLELLDEKPMTTTVWTKAAEREYGIKRTTFTKRKSELFKKELIEKVPGTEEWRRKTVAAAVDAGAAGNGAKGASKAVPVLISNPAPISASVSKPAPVSLPLAPVLGASEVVAGANVNRPSVEPSEKKRGETGSV